MRAKQHEFAFHLLFEIRHTSWAVRESSAKPIRTDPEKAAQTTGPTW